MSRRLRSPGLLGVVCSAVLAVGVNAHAQTPTPTPTPSAAPVPTVAPSLERQFIRNLLRDQKAIWTSPLHLRAIDARWLVPLSAGTAVFIATDRRTGDRIAESPQLLTGSRNVSYAGEGYTVAGTVVVFYVVARATHNERLRETAILGAEALINGGIASAVTKVAANRSRPFGGEDRGEFFTGGTSFPSGHSINVWALATIVAYEYHDRRWVQVVAYGLAGAVAVSRVTGQRHYPSDILVGSAIGYGIGRYVYHAHHQGSVSGDGALSRPAARKWPLIAPRYDRRARTYGLTLSWVY